MPKIENARKTKDQQSSATMIQTKMYDTPKVSKEMVSVYTF